MGKFQAVLGKEALEELGRQIKLKAKKLQQMEQIIIRLIKYLLRFITSTPTSWLKDKWSFIKSEKQWRWRRRSINGKIVGSSSESYYNFTDCKENAERNGFVQGVHSFKIDERNED